MLSTFSTDPSLLAIHRVLSQSGQEILSQLDDPESVKELTTLLVSATISLDKLESRNKILAIRPRDFSNKVLKFKMCILYLDSISKAMPNKQISQAMYDAIMHSTIRTFKSFTQSFSEKNHVWEIFFKTVPALLSLSDNPLLTSGDLIEKQIRPIFSKRISKNLLNQEIMSQDLIFAMKLALEQKVDLSFIAYLIKNQQTHKKFLNQFIFSLNRITPSPLTTEEVSNITHNLIQEIDKIFYENTPEQYSSKQDILTFVMRKSDLVRNGEKNPFIDFIKQNQELSIEIIKDSKRKTLNLKTVFIFNILKQAQFPIEPLLKNTKIERNINRILYGAIIHGNDKLTQLPLSSKENCLFISNKMAFIFNNITITSQNLKAILTNIIILAEKYIFKDIEMAITFINTITPPYRYHFSLALIFHLINNNHPVTSNILENISENLTPINDLTTSETSLIAHRLISIMNAIVSSDSKTESNISKDKLPLLFWVIKYFHNIINPDFFINPNEIFLKFFTTGMALKDPFYFQQPLINQIETFTRNYLTEIRRHSHKISIYSAMSAMQDTGQPPTKRPNTQPFRLPLLKGLTHPPYGPFEVPSSPNASESLNLHKDILYNLPSAVPIPLTFQFKAITSPDKRLFEDSYTQGHSFSL